MVRTEQEALDHDARLLEQPAQLEPEQDHGRLVEVTARNTRLIGHDPKPVAG